MQALVRPRFCEPELLELTVAQGAEFCERVLNDPSVIFPRWDSRPPFDFSKFISGEVEVRWRGQTIRVVPERPAARAGMFVAEEQPVWWERDGG